ncbi:putative response regulatory protein [compost metagenome]
MLKVMIVDDEYDIRQGLKHILNWEDKGFVICAEAEDGDKAWELFLAEKPHLVITDIRMPGKDGLELTRCIKSERPEVQIIVLSGHDDFHYAKEAFQYGVHDYLLKPVDQGELSGQVDKIKEWIEGEWLKQYEERLKNQWLQDYYYRKLVRGEPLPLESSLGTIHEEWLPEAGGYQVWLIELDNYGELLLENTEEQILLKRFAVRNIVTEMVGSYERGVVYEDSENRIGVVWAEPLAVDEADRLAGKIVEACRLYAKESISIGIGLQLKDLHALPQSYKLADSALEQSFFNRESHIFHAADERNSRSLWTLNWRADRLKKALSPFNREELDTQLKELFTELNQQSAPKEKIKYAIVYVVMELSQVVLEAGGDWKKLYQDLFEEDQWVTESKSLQEMRQRLTVLSEQTARFLDERRNAGSIDFGIREIVHYINEHYGEELNLKKLANLFYVNSGYLGQLFKKETGFYFNDYLNKVRIEEAVRMMADAGYSMSLISEKVGYKNPNHLYIHFKKMMGMSPGDYRKQLRTGSS